MRIQFALALLNTATAHKDYRHVLGTRRVTTGERAATSPQVALPPRRDPDRVPPPCPAHREPRLRGVPSREMAEEDRERELHDGEAERRAWRGALRERTHELGGTGCRGPAANMAPDGGKFRLGHRNTSWHLTS